MPPSGRRGKARARRAPAAEVAEPSDAETPEAITTPSRSSRKRARAAAEPPAPASRNTRRKVKDTRAIDREDTEGTEAQEHTDDETELAPPTEAEIIAHLKVADRHVNATEDFANDLLEGQENVPGYGKIAGRDWAFIIRKVEVNIGRPEVMEKLVAEENGQPAGPSSRTIVDIDLGPDRQVSRSHAIISYDPDSMQWFIIVNGRNGLRVDNNFLKRGLKSYLRNGSVIEIANTQMAFITTAADNADGPVWDGSIIRQAQKSSEEEDDGEDDTRNDNHRRPGHPTARSHLHDSSVYGNDLSGQQRRTHPHSQNAAMLGAPGTPMRTQQPPFTNKSSPAANYARGVMMESTETIDYSADSAKDLKPPHSYAQLIGMAILSTPEQQMTLNNIYKWIMANYAFYRFNTGGWQNSIRHNLSLNKAFTKIARRTDEPGKGMKWMIAPAEFDNFVQQGMKGCRRPNPMPGGGTGSTFGSPTSPMHVLRPSGANGVNVKRDGDLTPPSANIYRAFPSANEAYTPERGGHKRPLDPANIGLGINGDAAGPEYDYLTRSTPRNNANGLTAIANAAGSPPALFINEGALEGRFGGGLGTLDTPFPATRAPAFLVPPSTLRRPSDYIQLSSPAPFWKMEGLIGSTPFKPFDVSPIKTPFPDFGKGEAKKQGGDDEEEVDDDDEEEVEEEDGVEKRDGDGDVGEGTDAEAEADAVANGDALGVKRDRSPVIHSSSPPRPNSSGRGALDASPTLAKPAPAPATTATAVAKTLSQLAASSTASTMGNETGAAASETNAANINARAQQVQHSDAVPQAPAHTTAAAAPASSVAVATSSVPKTTQYLPPHTSASNANANSNYTYSAGGGGAGNVNVNVNVNGYHTHSHSHDEGDDEGIDLAKGFQPIGAFHQRNHLALGLGMGMQQAQASAFGR